MSAVEELKTILNNLCTKQEIEICAVISRNGIPLAYELPDGVHIDAFSTLNYVIYQADYHTLYPNPDYILSAKLMHYHIAELVKEFPEINFYFATDKIKINADNWNTF